jgi:ribonuclease HI
MTNKQEQVTYYTDGACSSNGNKPGAFAIIGVRNNEKFMSYDHAEFSTTSNRMELSAVIYTIKHLYVENMIVLSDSKYVVDGFNIWLKSWKRKDWYTSSGSEVLNQDLWKDIDMISRNKKFSLLWIRGHNNNFFNDEVDRLAKAKIIRN